MDGQSIEEFERDLKGEPVSDLESDVVGELFPAAGEGGGDPEGQEAAGSGSSGVPTDLAYNEVRQVACGFGVVVPGRDASVSNPLAGQRLRVLFERRYKASGLAFCCEGGPLGSVMLPVAWTDRSVVSSAQALGFEQLVELAALIRAVATHREQ